MARVTWGAEPDAVSMLHAVRYVKAAGGLSRMLDVEGGAQQDRFPAGTQQIAVRMADELGDRVVLGAPVRRIATARRRHADRRHRPAPSSSRARSRRRDPARAPRRPSSSTRPCPPSYGELSRHWPQGHLSKAYAAYETAVLARRRLLGGGAVRRGAGVHHVRLSARATTGPASCWGSPMRARSTRCPTSSAARSRWPVSPHCSVKPRHARSTTSTIVGAQSNSRRADRPRRCRRARGRRTAGGCAAPVDGIFWAGTETADVDRVPRRRGAVGSAGGRRGASGADAPLLIVGSPRCLSLRSPRHCPGLSRSATAGAR